MSGGASASKTTFSRASPAKRASSSPRDRLFRREHLETRVPAFVHDRRIAAHERGRRDDLAALEGDVERQVMPLDAPTPGLRVRRLVEDREVIAVGIANVPAFALIEDLLEVHDAERLADAVVAQHGAEQAVGEPALGRGEVPVRHALPLPRDEVPVEPFLVIEREGRPGSLTFVERHQEVPRPIDHLLGDIGCGSGPANRRRERYAREQQGRGP